MATIWPTMTTLGSGSICMLALFTKFMETAVQPYSTAEPMPRKGVACQAASSGGGWGPECSQPVEGQLPIGALPRHAPACTCAICLVVCIPSLTGLQSCSLASCPGAHQDVPQPFLYPCQPRPLARVSCSVSPAALTAIYMLLKAPTRRSLHGPGIHAASA